MIPWILTVPRDPPVKLEELTSELERCRKYSTKENALTTLIELKFLATMFYRTRTHKKRVEQLNFNLNFSSLKLSKYIYYNNLSRTYTFLIHRIYKRKESTLKNNFVQVIISQWFEQVSTIVPWDLEEETKRFLTKLYIFNFHFIPKRSQKII